MDIFELLSEFLSDLVDFVPNLLGALAILIIGWIIARIIRRLARNLLVRLKVDNLMDRLQDIDLVKSAPIKFKLSDLFARIVYYFILLIVTILAVDVLQMPGLIEVLSSVVIFIPDLFVVLVVLLLGLIVSDIIAKMVKSALDSLGIPSARIIGLFIFYFLFINVFLLALDQAGVETEFLETNISILIAGIVLAFSIGYGLATKTTAANFIGSVQSKGKFKAGDEIKIGKIEGEIREINRSNITLATEEGIVYIPMSKLSEEIVYIKKSK